MVCFDAGVLIDLFNERLSGPRKQRIDLLMTKLGKEKVAIPAPAYAEFLTRSAAARDSYIQRISSSSTFKVEPFSNRAAIECAIILEGIFTSKQKKEISKTKMKFDWMIVATAKAVNASTIYTTDADIVRACTHAKLDCSHVDDIIIPPETPDLFNTALA